MFTVCWVQSVLCVFWCDPHRPILARTSSGPQDHLVYGIPIQDTYTAKLTRNVLSAVVATAMLVRAAQGTPRGLTESARETHPQCRLLTHI